MRKIFISFTFVFLAAACTLPSNQPSGNPPGGVACTQEAKLCPDGSYVSRRGPNCEFAACPSATSTPPKATSTPPAPAPAPTPTGGSGISGTVTLGPTCPVMRYPPEPQCSDKPYQATVKVMSQDGSKEITQFTSSEDGTFKINLAPGTYLLQPESPNMLPRAGSQQVTVLANRYTTVTIMYDTGIR